MATDTTYYLHMTKDLSIRNSTIDFLVFTKQAGEDGINVHVEDETVWVTVEAIAKLFDRARTTITEHIQNIYSSGELDKESTCRKFRHMGENGQEYFPKYYNLDMIISVGYRVDSIRATQFRQWATRVLKEFSTKGYVLDKERLKNGQVFSNEYFDHLLDEIQEIRSSERLFYQKITDIYATAHDYDVNAPTTHEFFSAVQNKMHFAVHGHTAAEIIKERADADKEHMGLTTWKNAPRGKIVRGDVSVAKNYLSDSEMKNMNQLVSMYLDYASRQASKHIPMTMQDWAGKLDFFLTMNDEKLLVGKGTVSHEEAKIYAESEFEKYRLIQDALFKSDFDLFAIALDQGIES